MKAMKPLLYLTYRTILNGLKRAVTTPKRLLYFIFFVGYYFVLFIRPALTSSTAPRLPDSVAGKLSFPPLEILDAFVFGLFLMMSFILLIGIVGSTAPSRPADVDVLFPTPVSPKLVLAFRMFRDYMFTLLTPLLAVILGLRASKVGWEAVFRNMPHPEYSGLAIRAMSVSWILMALCFVALTHAVGLFLNRTDGNTSRYKVIAAWGVGVFIAGWIGFLIWDIVQVPTWSHVVELARWPVLRVVFFIATFATELAMSPFHGSLKMALLGGVGLLATIAVSIRLAMGQAAWYYDQCAVKGFGANRTRELQRAGDFTGILAERARTGKYKVRRMMWIHRLKMPGPRALLWKEMFLQPRTMLPLLFILAGSQIALSILPAFMGPSATVRQSGIVLLIMQGMLTMMVTLLMGQTGFIEVLRRVDLQKALPFAPAKIVFYEILGRSVAGWIASWLGIIAMLSLAPENWAYGLCAALFTPGLTVLLSASIFFVTMLFPDIDDPTQRQFRGLMMLLGIAIASFFPIIAIVVLLALHVFPPLVGIVAAVICLAIALLLAALSGQIYATFNPSE